MSAFEQEQFASFAHAYPSLDTVATFKSIPEDFIVEEELPFTLAGVGEHAWLHVRKRDNNTDWVAARIAEFAGVKKHAVGYAGLKDRYAVTTQWFSVYLPGRDDINWDDFCCEGVELITVTRHQRKLQRGALKQNRFIIRLRDIEPGNAAVFDKLFERCELIRREGVPNYFGEQRFGRGLRNLADAERMFTQPHRRMARHKRSLLLSAARSWIFNAIVAKRVETDTWNRYVQGDVFMLDGRSACFSDDHSAELEQRLVKGEIHPTAVLWGDGESMSSAECAAIESEIVDRYPVFKQGLRDARVDQQRRAMRLLVKDLECHQTNSDLVLMFSLQAGSYATMVLRELVKLEEISADSRAS
ncbi:MAG: tRNA pseudouridine(13) synthase TruD [Gammaproteobacteria bacterium]|jgi:tRNA pseudouridine13 synthase